MEHRGVSFLITDAPGPGHSQVRRRARLNFQRRGSVADAGLASASGSTEPDDCGTAPEGGEPEPTPPAGGRAAVAGGGTGGQSWA